MISDFAKLPSIDFELLRTQAMMAAKNVLIVFLYLKKKLRSRKITITEIIDSAIMDVKRRKQIQKYANEILNLLPT